MMDGPTKGIWVNSTGPDVHVRVVGRGTFQNSQPLRRYAMEKLEQGCNQFYVDLGQCQGMDSTFLGVLAGVGLRLAESRQRGQVHMVNVSPRNVELLQTLGLDRLFDVNLVGRDHTGHPFPQEDAFQLLPDTEAAPSVELRKLDTASFMLEAHDNLIRADPRNAPKFQDLTRYLREKIAGSSPGQKPAS